MKNINLTAPQNELIELFSHKEWRQRIHLFDEVFTPGTRCEYEWDLCHLPADLKGTTFLDVGANDGMFSFLAESKGASEVTAIDLYVKDHTSGSMTTGWPVDKIETIKKLRNSKINIRHASVYDLSSLQKKFDVTYCGNVLTWLKDPVAAIKQMAAVTNKTLLIREDVSGIKGNPVLEYIDSISQGFIFNGNFEFYRAYLMTLGFRKVSFKVIDEYKIFERRSKDFLKYKLPKGTLVFKNPFSDSEGVLEKDITSAASVCVNGKFFFTEIGWVNRDDVRPLKGNLPQQFVKKWIFERRIRKGLRKHVLVIAEK